MCKHMRMHITVIFIQIYKPKLDGNTTCPASVTQIYWDNTHTHVILVSFSAWNHRSGIISRLKPLSKHIFTHFKTIYGRFFYVLIWFLIGINCDLTTSCMERLKVSSSVRMRRMMRAMYTWWEFLSSTWYKISRIGNTFRDRKTRSFTIVWPMVILFLILDADILESREADCW